MKSTAIICAYNEVAPRENYISYLENSIKSVIDCLGAGLLTNAIFVNDGSTDKTKEVIWNLIRDVPNAELISYLKNLGKAKAWLKGLEKVQNNPEIIVNLDADMRNFEPKFLKQMYGAFDDRTNMVIGIYSRVSEDKIYKTFPVGKEFSGIRVMKFNCLDEILNPKETDYINAREWFEYSSPSYGYRLEKIIHKIIPKQNIKQVYLEGLWMREPGKGPYTMDQIIKAVCFHYEDKLLI